MSQSLSEDLRERILAAVQRGASRREVAKRFDVAPSTVTKLVQRVARTGSLKPAARGGDRRSGRIEAHAGEILDLIARTSDVTLEEIAAHLKRTRNETFVVSTIWRCLDRHGLTFKKNSSRERAEPSRRGRGPGTVARSPGGS